MNFKKGLVVMQPRLDKIENFSTYGGIFYYKQIYTNLCYK